MKKILLFGIFLLLISFVSAAEIINYKIPFSVRLGEKLSVHGFYSDTDINGVLCKFEIFDSNNVLVERLSDEYVFSDGSFSTEKVLQEPPFFRGDDFNVQTTCKTTSVSAIFSVEQPLNLSHITQQTSEYIFDMGNLKPVFFVASFAALILVVGIVGGFFYKRIKEGI